MASRPEVRRVKPRRNKTASSRRTPKQPQVAPRWRCLVPERTDGLLAAGRCLSATPDALGSARVMAICMATGQAAGAAAALAARSGRAPRDVPAADVLKADPAGDIGLIPCAVGGTGLDQWKPGGALYSNAVARARAAMKGGVLAGILWHQGESDARPEKIATYPERFAAMVAALRRDLGVEGVPVLVGELIRSRDSHGPFNAMLSTLPAKVPVCATVSAEGLVPNRAGDVHFDAASLRTFGSRYAEAYLMLRRSGN